MQWTVKSLIQFVEPIQWQAGTVKNISEFKSQLKNVLLRDDKISFNGQWHQKLNVFNVHHCQHPNLEIIMTNLVDNTPS